MISDKSDINIVIWAEERLIALGYVIKNRPETILKLPYSNVLRFLTESGAVYLKETPEALSIEPKIIRLISERYHGRVPLIIDSNEDLNCFLMKDAGTPLRDFLKDNFQVELLCQSIKKYTEIQKDSIADVLEFLSLGVLDWRLNRLPELYNDMITQEELLFTNGISQDELNVLQEMRTVCASLCEILSEYSIPQTINHCDLHDNNILIENNLKTETIIDWGETVISFPLFSLISFLSTSAFRYSLKESDSAFIELRDAALENWLSFANSHILLEAMLIAKKLWPIYSALGYHRLMVSSNMNMDQDNLKNWFTTNRNQGRLGNYFKEFIRLNANSDPKDTSQVKLSDPARVIKG